MVKLPDPVDVKEMLKRFVSEQLEFDKEFDEEQAAEEERLAFNGHAGAQQWSSEEKLVITSAEFISGYVPPEYAIDNLLQRRFCYSLTALTGHGKTAIALLLAMHKALGWPLGKRGIDQGSVLYLAGENPDDLRVRWLIMADKYNFNPNTIPVYFIAGVKNLREVGPLIKQAVDQIGGVSTVFIDTSAAYFIGEDENSNVQLGNYARLLRNLGQSLLGGPCMLVLCHPVKNASRENLLPRGGGAFVNEVDGNLTAWKDDSIVYLHWSGKFRGVEFAPISFVLETATSHLVTDSKGRLIPSVIAKVLTETEESQIEAKQGEDEEAVLVALADGGKQSTAVLADRLGWFDFHGEPYKMKVKRAIDRLKVDKLVETDRHGSELTDLGKKELKKKRGGNNKKGG
jgi:hypothetical protein